MATTLSKDGTKTAYDKTGQRPALILVAGAFQDRMSMSAYAGSLSKHFTIYEPPFVVDDSRSPPPEDIVDQLKDLIADGRRGDAAETLVD